MAKSHRSGSKSKGSKSAPRRKAKSRAKAKRAPGHGYGGAIESAASAASVRGLERSYSAAKGNYHKLGDALRKAHERARR